MDERLAVAPAPEAFEQFRGELNAYCYRMLGSPFEAEDAVQDTLVRAWRSLDRFEGRASLRSWLYRIATNVCFDMRRSGQRRARPMDPPIGPAQGPLLDNLATRSEATWIEPIPDPADAAVAHETIRLAFIAALQRLPARQRAVLILCEVLNWQAAEAAELLETTLAAVNSALQRARATLAAQQPDALEIVPALDDEAERALLERYVRAFERYDLEALTALIREDASQSMPPYDMWLAGRDNLLAWWVGPGIGCRGSRVLPAGRANGSPAFGQYKPAPGGGYEPWALQVLELSGAAIVEFTFFLDTERLFPRFGLPPRLEA